MPALIGYARVSARRQGPDPQLAALRSAGVLEEDLHVDVSELDAEDSRATLDATLRALAPGDTLVVASLDRLAGSTAEVLALAEELRSMGAALRVLDLDGRDVATSSADGAVLFNVLAALAKMESALQRERVLDSVRRRRASEARAQATAGRDLVPPAVPGGTHPPALHGLTVPITRR